MKPNMDPATYSITSRSMNMTFYKVIFLTVIVLPSLYMLYNKTNKTLTIATEYTESEYTEETVSINTTSLQKTLKIPKLIHQSWKSKSLPQKFQEWSNSWKIMNPEYSHKVWTDEENRELIVNHYPWFLKKYDSFPRNIMRIDSARIFYLHKYGGVYSDLDVLCLKPMDDGHDLVLGRMGDDLEFTHSIPNAWFASKPGHSFWMWYANLILENFQFDGVEWVAGPVALFATYDAYRKNVTEEKSEEIYVAPKEYVFPYNWQYPEFHDICSAMSNTFNQTLCNETTDPEKKAFAISYWSHSWDGGFQGGN